MSLVDDVKSRTDIVQVIADYVDLDTSSRTPKARCPFHAERTPSFVIYPESGTWHCFGACATGGDVISFLMKKDNLSFGDALRQLADRAGIRHEERGQSSDARQRPKSTIFEANEVAGTWFHSLLKAPGGEAARTYLAERGISIEVAERRGMGLAPTGGMVSLSGHLKSRNIDGRAARDARLVVQSRDGGWNDFFRGRLTIEIRDARGQLVGFGARSLDGSEPKYLNTPKTDVFDKSSILYGVNWAAESIRAAGEAVVVEGYMDAITAHEHGFTNVVASMGTAVTSEQLQQLARLVGGRDRVGRVILCLDSDAAGAEATMRALEEALQEFWFSLARGRVGDMEIRIARSVGGKDPDEAIRTNADGWRQSLRETVPLIDHLIKSKKSLYDTSTGDGKTRYVQDVARVILAIRNDFDLDKYWLMLAEEADVPVERMKSLLPRRQQSGGRGGNRTRQPRGNSERGISAEQAAAYMDAKPWESLEEHLLVMLLRHDELREFGLPVAPEVFTDTVNREIFTAWRTSSTLGELFAQLDTELAERASQLAERELPPAEQVVRVDEVKQCIRRLSVRFHVGRIELQERVFEEQETTLDESARDELRKRVLEHTEALRQLHTQQA